MTQALLSQEDARYMAKDLTKMSLIELNDYRILLESRLKATTAEIESFSRNICSICEKEDIGRDGLPAEWGWVSTLNLLACDSCCDKLEKKGLKIWHP